MTFVARSLIATPETDRKLRRQQTKAGAKARAEGRPRESCPHYPGSMIAGWWLEGWDGMIAEPLRPLTA